MITFNNASFHYTGEHGTGEGVDNIDLTIGTGEVVVLCGRSGCGKTTITRMINGLAPHFYEGLFEGSVFIDDFCVNEAELSETSRHVGSIFQNPKSQFFNVDTTGEVAFGCENLCMPRERIVKRVAATVEELDISALMNRSIFELSGGEKQQIACGSVYAAQPEVFVMDEPSSNLDKKAIQRLRAVLIRLKAEGRTIVISEHRLYYLMDVADRFVYLNDGRITHEWSVHEFAALPDDELAACGLRTTDLRRITVSRSSYEDSSPSDTDVSSAGVSGSGFFAAAPVDRDLRGDFTQQDASQPAVEGLDLSCNRGNVQILDIEELSLPAGAIVALVGDNGSGKSTLAEALCGIGNVDGSIAFDGHYLSNKARASKSFMVMQDVNLQLFCDSVIEEVMMNAQVTREKAHDILQRLRLSDVEERHPASLSGGQKQRVAIASALCAGKRFLFYDEPTSGLDRDGMTRFGELLNDVAGAAELSVVITHDLELVVHCCTHVLHIQDGRVVGLYPLDADGIARVRGYFLSTSGRSTSRRRKNQGHIARILSYTGTYRRYTYASVFVLLVAQIARLIPYLLVFYLLSMLLGGQAITFESGMALVGGVLAAELTYALLYPLGLSLSHVAAYRTLENIRTSIQDRLDAQPVGVINEMGTGAIKKLLSEDVESIEVLLAHVIPEGLANLIVPAISLLLMAAIEWQLALLVVAMVFLGYLASSQMYKTGIDNMGSYYASTKRLNNTIIEYVNGMEVVKVFNRDGEAGARLRNMVRDYRDYALGWYKVCWPWMAAYTSIFTQVALYTMPIGALLVLTGQLALASYVLVLCLAFGLGPMLLHCIGFVAALPQVNYKIQALEKAADRSPLMVGEDEYAGRPADVMLANVRFSYGNTEALRGVSLTAHSGEVTAIVGESGSGKSTVAKLIAHHYDASEGAVYIGKQDIRSLAYTAGANLVAYVSQDLFLYNTSLAENIRVGKQDATDAEVIYAARAAQCDAFVEALPKGLDTQAGVAGAKLSGGERQRITLARAFVKGAPVLVLDEATAYLDAACEALVMDEVFAAAHERGCSVIVVAHRLRSIAGADKIYVMNAGGIEACGTHAELLETSSRYRALWDASERGAAWTIASDSPC